MSEQPRPKNAFSFGAKPPAKPAVPAPPVPAVTPEIPASPEPQSFAINPGLPPPPPPPSINPMLPPAPLPEGSGPQAPPPMAKRSQTNVFGGKFGAGAAANNSAPKAVKPQQVLMQHAPMPTFNSSAPTQAVSPKPASNPGFTTVPTRGMSSPGFASATTQAVPSPISPSAPTMLESVAEKTEITPPQDTGATSAEQTEIESTDLGVIKKSQTAVTILSVPPQDLSRENLLSPASRQTFESHKMVPTLGGIPLLAKLGQGGMGAVYYGFHPTLRREVAIKVLPFHLAERQPEMIDRFFREAQIAAKIKSPYLVSVSDAREEQGLCYLVMEFVSGPSAGSYLKKNFPRGMHEAEALDICIAATKGLMAAHDEGVIHRDIKPDNILLPAGKGGKFPRLEEAKLADLGLARNEEHGQSLTGSQTAMGTPGYMSPEQAMDARKCGKPADIFSMGATLYALLTGRPPFYGPAGMEIILATVQKPHERVTSVRPEVSPATAALIDRCLEKQPNARFRDAATLMSALQACRAAIGKSLDEQNKAVTEVKAGWTPGEIKPIATLPNRRNEPDTDLGLNSGSAEVTGVRAAGLLRTAEAPQRDNKTMVAIILLTLFVGMGMGMILLGPAAPTPQPKTDLPIIEHDPINLTPQANAPKPTTPDAPKNRMEEIAQQQRDNLEGINKGLNRAMDMADKQKIVAPVLPISSIPLDDESTSRYTPAALVLNLLMSVLGMSYTMYGRKKPDFNFIFAGCGMAIFGWFITSIGLSFIVAGVLISAPLFLSRR